MLISGGPTNGVMQADDIDDTVQIVCNGFIPTTSEDWPFTCDNPEEYESNEDLQEELESEVSE